MPKVRAGNVTLNYEQQGGGPPLILIPYLAADHACYAFQVQAYSQHFTCICLDLRELTFLDSCGLARLVAARRRAMKAGRRLVLVRGPAAVQRVFQLTAVDEAFEIVNAPEALTA